MQNTRSTIRALHVHDAANVGRNLVEAANELGQQWSMTDIPWYYKRAWTGPLKHPALRTRPVIWDGMLALKSMRVDVVHLHTGGLSPHMRWLKCPWVLHLHGTDVRTRQYDGWGEKLRFGAAHAGAVVYSTPDLKPHVLNLTDEGIYLPVTVRLDRAAPWQPVERRVIFASRWSAVKGAEAQIDVARRLQAARPDLELLGLDWGEYADGAREAGVTLVPKKPYDEYRTWLGTASVVVGQMYSALGTSELEALAAGVPMVSSAKPSFYPDLHLLGGADASTVADAVLEAIEDPRRSAALQGGKDYIAKVHDAPVGVRRLLDIYAGLLPQ